jgi:hypothetical protein
MEDDKRCCGSGTCIIDARGQCWCGQQWNGEKMCRPSQSDAPFSAPEALHKQLNQEAKPNVRNST